STVPQILAGTIIPMVLSSLFVFARLYTRGILTRSWGIDDTLITISWFGAIALSILNCICVTYGMGSHQYLQNAAEAVTTAWLSYALRLIYQLVLGTTKLGICMFYLRVFQDRTSQILVFSMIGFICLFTVPLEIYVALRCREVDPLVSNSLTCVHNTPDLYLFAICSIISDALLVIFVIPRVLPLQLELKQKVALLAVLCLSLLVITAAIARLIEVTQFNNSRDHTLNSFRITTWSALEIDTGLFCASAPALKPLVRKWSKSSSSSNSYTRSNMHQRQQDHVAVTRSRGGVYHGSSQIEESYEMDSQECLQTPANILTTKTKLRDTI
ncbi:hypothetical protein BGZ63DRAFT_368667, partial [Mariannaea sp. PMI_226]